MNIHPLQLSWIFLGTLACTFDKGVASECWGEGIFLEILFFIRGKYSTYNVILSTNLWVFNYKIVSMHLYTWIIFHIRRGWFFFMVEGGVWMFCDCEPNFPTHHASVKRPLPSMYNLFFNRADLIFKIIHSISVTPCSWILLNMTTSTFSNGQV